MKTTVRFVLMSALLTLAACGAGEVGGADDVGTDGDALSTVTPALVSITVDQRKCAAPACGGYWVSQLNHTTAAIYVSGLDFSQANLSADDVARVTSAPAAEIVLNGKLSKKKNGVQQLIVLDAYRGMPGRTAAAGDAFYSVTHEAKQCFAAPCNQDTAHKLNSTAQPKGITTLDVSAATGAFGDQAWLAGRVEQNGALVAASINKGQKYAAGTEQILAASQVFVHLPEGVGVCSMHILSCMQGKVLIWDRDANRCMNNDGCVTPGMCSMMVPACSDGYVLSSWRSGDNACPHYVCDPAWLQ